MMTDVTETRLLQQKLSHNARLVSVGETAAALAHQIRTPLAAALLNLPNLTAATGTESDRRRYAERIKTSLKHLSRLVEQMLMYSRAGTFTYQTVSIRELLDVHKDVFEGRIKQSGGELAVSSPTEDVQITGNFDALLTALQNLTNNALEAREIDCRVTIDIANQSDHIDINVKDNGPGIPSSELTNIFEPFYSHAKRGSGLGLAVVKTVATAHVGEVRVKNTVPEGCIFTLSLPKKLNKVPSAEIQENEAVV
jgi:two-component system sensor histidine kinase FlrB